MDISTVGLEGLHYKTVDSLFMRRVFHQTCRRAFTLVELSVVVVILSILIATVLVSRNLIANAKIEKIMEEFRSFNTAVATFSDTYGCLPSDCNSTQVADLTAKGLNPNCSDGYNGPVNVGLIDRSVKRTCMMHALRIAQFNSPADTIYPNNYYYRSFAGVNVPYAKFSNDATWDFRSSTGPNSTVSVGNFAPTGVNMPVEVGDSASTYLASLLNRHMFVLRAASLDNSLGYPATFNEDICTSGGTASTATIKGTTKYGISSLMAHKLDTKFDDGLPYGGNIIGGKTATDFIGDTTGAICNTKVGPSGTYTSVTYTDSVDIVKGCLVAFVTTY